MIRTALSSLRGRIREFFLLEQAQRKSATLTAAQRDAMQAYAEAGTRRLQVARDLRGPSGAPVALSLYREGGLLLALGFLHSKDTNFELGAVTPETAFQKFDAALEAAALAPPPEFERAKPLLLSTDPLELDRLPADDAGRKADELEQATQWLSTLFDPRSPRAFKTQRLLRLVVAGLSALALLVMLGVWVFSPKNLAEGKPVLSSSKMYDTQPTGAVDGSKTGTYGFHSALEPSPWLSIDLGRHHAIERIKVYGRGDGHNDQSIPLALEVSDDSATYRQVASRAEPFSEADPWVIRPNALQTRFIRLRTLRQSYLVLGEVEVYAK